MQLIKASFSELNKQKFYTKYGSAQAIVTQFKDSDMDIARVERDTWNKNTNGASILNNAIKRLRIGGIKAITNNGKVYLIKTDKVK